MCKALQWKANDAYWQGRLVLRVIKEHTGWKLYRYSQRNDGSVVFKSKESVRSRKAGHDYAESLSRLWPR